MIPHTNSTFHSDPSNSFQTIVPRPTTFDVKALGLVTLWHTIYPGNIKALTRPRIARKPSEDLGWAKRTQLPRLKPFAMQAVHHHMHRICMWCLTVTQWTPDSDNSKNKVTRDWTTRENSFFLRSLRGMGENKKDWVDFLEKSKKWQTWGKTGIWSSAKLECGNQGV